MLGEGAEPRTGEMVSQELGLLYGELTFALANRQAVNSTQLQDVSEILNMRL